MHETRPWLGAIEAKNVSASVFWNQASRNAIFNINAKKRRKAALRLRSPNRQKTQFSEKNKIFYKIVVTQTRNAEAQPAKIVLSLTFFAISKKRFLLERCSKNANRYKTGALSSRERSELEAKNTIFADAVFQKLGVLPKQKK